MTPPSFNKGPALLAVLLVATMLAGCMGREDTTDRDAFEAALAAPGEVYQPTSQQGETEFRIKLLSPADPDAAQQGQQPLEVLVYDQRTTAPVTDATLFVESWMMEHDHGTGGETHPAHTNGGVYRGATNHVMAGPWEVRLEGVRATGDTFRVAISFTVQ